MPPRRSRLQSSGRIKAKKPSAAEQERKYGPPARREWMKRQPCCVCGRTPSDSAHVTNGGLSRKAHYTRTVPLCADNVARGYSGHHSEYDDGKRSFVAKYGILMALTAAQTEAKWLRHQSALEHVGSILPRALAEWQEEP
jgi:hypothetical protein